MVGARRRKEHSGGAGRATEDCGLWNRWKSEPEQRPSAWFDGRRRRPIRALPRPNGGHRGRPTAAQTMIRARYFCPPSRPVAASYNRSAALLRAVCTQVSVHHEAPRGARARGTKTGRTVSCWSRPRPALKQAATGPRRPRDRARPWVRLRRDRSQAHAGVRGGCCFRSLRPRSSSAAPEPSVGSLSPPTPDRASTGPDGTLGNGHAVLTAWEAPDDLVHLRSLDRRGLSAL